MLGFGQLLTAILGAIPANLSSNEGTPKPQTDIHIVLPLQL